MKALKKTIKENRVTLVWYALLLLVLSLFGESCNIGSSITGVSKYWANHFIDLVSHLGNTLLVAFPAAFGLLLVSFSLALAAVSRPILYAGLKILVILLSILPSVYLIHLLRSLRPGMPMHSETFAVLFLMFSNLVIYFFFLGFKKDIHQEFRKDYHFLARQLGIKSKLATAAQKLFLIALERFLPLFIMVFSATIFVESKLNITGGIYISLYNDIKSTAVKGRPDIIWGQLLFILGFVLILQLTYGTLVNHIKEKHF